MNSDVVTAAPLNPGNGGGGGPVDWPVFITFAVVFLLVGGWIVWNKIKGRG
ncbi:hypothetical protein [Klenkia brasiliensis]|uniref:hypothetical protein n=1 Tax=Klenkia brasiliensis TaxID=333142 RepID=UPI0013F5A54E|nr:hypothetical protein [Klenkia brasiliensis]